MEDMGIALIPNFPSDEERERSQNLSVGCHFVPPTLEHRPLVGVDIAKANPIFDEALKPNSEETIDKKM